MGKIKMFISSLFFVGLLVGCGEEVAENEESAERNENASKEKSEEITESNKDDRKEDKSSEEKEETEEQEEVSEDERVIGETYETDGGSFTFVKTIDKENIFESGPMELNITGIDIYDFEPSEEFKEYLDDIGDQAVMVRVLMSVSNNSEDTINWYPDQATLVTNTGEQVEKEMFLSEGNAGGTFYGKVVQEGSIVYILDKSKSKDIEWMKFIISAPHEEETWDDVGEEIQPQLNFE